MSQILNIFRKDVRHLMPFIVVVLALQIAIAVATVRLVGIVDGAQRLESMVALCEVLLPFGWIFLIAPLVLQDPPVGENSFWLTRPYSWLSLFLAKLLFAFVFLNLPLFISDCLILETLGLPFDVSRLLLRQLPLIAVALVPAFGLSSISRSVSQFSLFLAMLILIFILESFGVAGFSRSHPSIRVPDLWAVLLLPLAALSVIVIQFARRAPSTRILLAALLAILLPPMFFMSHLAQDGAFFVTKRTDFKATEDGSNVSIQIETPAPRTTIPDGSFTWLGAKLPVTVQGLLPGQILRGEGETRIGSLQKRFQSSLVYENGHYFLWVEISGRNAPGTWRVSLQTSLNAWILNDKFTYQTTIGRPAVVRIPDIGLCALGPQMTGINCWSGPARRTDATVKVDAAERISPFELHSEIGPDSYRYDELSWDFTPLEKGGFQLGKDVGLAVGSVVSFAPEFPVARFQRTLTVSEYPMSGAIHELEFKERPLQ
jgi:hypothetical protein